jgi:hypothetical protein
MRSRTSAALWLAILTAAAMSGSVLSSRAESVPPIVQDGRSSSGPESFDLERRRREHWVWQSIQKPAIPPVRNAAWPTNPIDHFVLARLETAGLEPASPAEKRALIRRVTFDLIGLPPSLDEIEAYLADDSPDAFSRVVDRLLASPHFGERWGRHWLDLVRYAETRGHEFDHIIPNAYQYRDYVIRAMNADVPYDQFVTEHIAGDLMRDPRRHPVQGFNESILGTGFWFLGEELHSPVDIRGDETDRIDNRIDVYSKSFLGLTVSCARCHDHKFDAISTRDYYALAGYLLSSSYRQVPFESMDRSRRLADECEALQTTVRPSAGRAIARAESPVAEGLARYLSASREAIRVRQPSASGSAATAVDVDPIALRHRVDATRLRRWIEVVEAARTDPDSPLHLWSLLSHEAENGDARASIGRQLDTFARRAAEYRDSWKGVRQIVDFTAPAADDWSQDGVVFGLRPTRVGEIRFGSQPLQPIAEISQFSAACSEPAWDNLRLATDTERDPGKVGWGQAGRTLRTRTFSLASGKLHYLVRGAGNAYAAVDSHRLIAGPLHGALTRSWEAAPQGKWQWIEQDLSAYPEHRVHVEFSPKDAGGSHAATELAVLAVVEGEKAPALSDNNASLFASLVDRNDLSLEAVARAYQELAIDTLKELAVDRIAESANPRRLATFAAWMLQNADLFADRAEFESQLAEAARPYFERSRELAAGFQNTSHTAPALLDGSGVDEFVLNRGNHRTPGAPVQRRFLEAMASRGDATTGSDESPHCSGDHSGALDPTHRGDAATGSGRLDLVQQMLDRNNPLVARVIVNRVWHHLFGRGIVASVDNFGVMGDRPTHPELLDFLAVRFTEQGWSIKELIREMVQSSTYRMSATPNPDAIAADPQSHLMHHMPVRRLEGEVIRDAILTTSGRLGRRFFGPSTELHLTPFMEGRGRPTVSGALDGDGRRSVYLRVRRNFSEPMLSAFDAPTPFSTIGRRCVSNVPAQALVLMNNEFVLTEAKRWARRAIEGHPAPAARTEQMFQTAFGRLPAADERDEVLQFVREQQARYGADESDPRPWEDLAHVLLNAKEFIFIQ